ncbi:BadF/BadG/BcrA/BcrD ATPase family protein [uncultured Roseobacter sp.]|uniref:BadF/BadG/BcrA/BcrD ATPase family protein n=1 Tax=uncultured Roseobacter sp. TaxID=114847 RepID=UPI00261C98DD|nr:BadF/BadG/BcrA/BcrD ATPase family protein [uncultured Roseobacter sp.]
MSDVSSYLFVGVDGGGTGCRVAIEGATGTRLAEAAGGPANYTTDPCRATQSVREALRAAAADAGLSSGWSERCIAHVGLAGVMSPEEGDALARELSFARVTVTDDRVTSVAGALGDRDGMLAAIGTGTIVAGRTDETTRFVGGWGHDLADQASGGWLGRKALRRMMLAHDGVAAHTDLTRALLAGFGGDPKAIMAFTNDAGPGDFARLARQIIDAARAGDPMGTALMQEGARFLHDCADSIGLVGDAVLCLAGGVGPSYADYLNPACRARLRPSHGTALDGALRLAREAFEKRKAPS